jgi:hypothetical protein
MQQKKNEFITSDEQWKRIIAHIFVASKELIGIKDELVDHFIATNIGLNQIAMAAYTKDGRETTVDPKYCDQLLEAGKKLAPINKFLFKPEEIVGAPNYYEEYTDLMNIFGGSLHVCLTKMEVLLANSDTGQFEKYKDVYTAYLRAKHLFFTPHDVRPDKGQYEKAKLLFKRLENKEAALDKLKKITDSGKMAELVDKITQKFLNSDNHEFTMGDLVKAVRETFEEEEEK